jgi:hypothetical protein
MLVMTLIPIGDAVVVLRWEEVKSCKAISNDQQRLKCFDSLFADKPDQTKPSEKSAKEDHWSIEESKSPTDGSLQIIAANLADDTVLILRCKDQTTEAAFSTRYNYLGSGSVDTLRCVSTTKSHLRSYGKRQ